MLKVKYFPITIIFYMENEIVDKLNLIEKIKDIIKKKKKLFILVLFFIIIALLGIVFLNYYENSQNKKVSEKYIKAGIYLSSKNTEKSKLIYKEIVLSRNKFYSILALNNIVENNLEENNDEVLKLFEIVEDIKTEKEHKNIIKLKKALYLIKISKFDEGNKLLKEIISNNSIWKEIALDISK